LWAPSSCRPRGISPEVIPPIPPCRFPRERAKAAPQSTAAGRASPSPYRFPAGQPPQRFRRRSVPATRKPPLLRFRSTEGQILKLFAVALSLQRGRSRSSLSSVVNEGSPSLEGSLTGGLVLRVHCRRDPSGRSPLSFAVASGRCPLPVDHHRPRSPRRRRPRRPTAGPPSSPSSPSAVVRRPSPVVRRPSPAAAHSAPPRTLPHRAEKCCKLHIGMVLSGNVSGWCIRAYGCDSFIPL
jgi:hypothetical protein